MGQLIGQPGILLIGQIIHRAVTGEPKDPILQLRFILPQEILSQLCFHLKIIKQQIIIEILVLNIQIINHQPVDRKRGHGMGQLIDQPGILLIGQIIQRAVTGEPKDPIPQLQLITQQPVDQELGQ